MKAAAGALIAITLMSAMGACTIDSKGRWCGIVGILSDSAGHQYCRDDENAAADCEVLNAAILDAAALCVGGPADEADLRSAGVLENCDNAGATTNELEECLAQLGDTADPPCDGAAFDKPDICFGVVLDPIFSDNMPG